MANIVFADAQDSWINTPANVPAWTVQNSATGSNQNTVASAGATLALATATKAAHVANVTPATDGTAVGTAFNALLAALQGAGLEA